MSESKTLTKARNEALKSIDTRNAIVAIMDKVRVPKMRRYTTLTNKEKEVRHVEFVRLPKEGGILTYFQGYKYPAKGFPVAEACERVDDIKKNLYALLHGFKQMFEENRVKTILFLLVFRKQYQVGFETLIHSMWRQVRQYDLQERYYCQSVRELIRVFDLMQKRSDGSKRQKDLIYRIKRLVCMILEYDDAYRYRFQDALGGLDKESFAKKPFKELERVVKIGSQSESCKRVVGSWKAALLLLKLVRFSPIRKDIVFFIGNLNLEEIKLSVEDYSFAKEKPDYAWHGVMK